MNEIITVITSDEGDWIGVYRDGKLIEEGHSIGTTTLLERLGFEVAHIEWDEAKFNEFGGHCPATLPS